MLRDIKGHLLTEGIWEISPSLNEKKAESARGGALCGLRPDGNLRKISITTWKSKFAAAPYPVQQSSKNVQGELEWKAGRGVLSASASPVVFMQSPRDWKEIFPLVSNKMAKLNNFAVLDWLLVVAFALAGPRQAIWCLQPRATVFANSKGQIWINDTKMYVTQTLLDYSARHTDGPSTERLNTVHTPTVGQSDVRLMEMTRFFMQKVLFRISSSHGTLLEISLASLETRTHTHTNVFASRIKIWHRNLFFWCFFVIFIIVSCSSGHI